MKTTIIRIAIILFLGMFFSNGITANNDQETTDNKCISVLSDPLIQGRYRYVGYCTGGGGFTIYIYKDENYYYGSTCDPDYDLNKEGCRPERLYKDDKGWHRLRDGEKYYLYYYYRGDKCIVRDIERDTNKGY